MDKNKPFTIPFLPSASTLVGPYFVFVFFIMMYFPITSLVATSWSRMGDRYGHGWLVFVVFLFMVKEVDQKYSFQQNQLRTNLLLWCALLGGGGVVVAAFIMSIQVVMMNLLPILLLFCFAAAFGVSYAKKMLLPCFYLFCGLPIWNYINTILQTVTSLVVGSWLQWMDFTAYISGNTIVIPSGVFEVAGGCSGFKYFISSVAISLLYGFLYANSIAKKIGVFLLAISLAIVANWIRVAIVVYVGYETQMQHDWVRDHDNMGWVVYGLSLIPFFWVANKMTIGFTDDEEAISKSDLSLRSVWQKVGKLRLITTLIVICFPFSLFYLINGVWVEHAVPQRMPAEEWRVLETKNNTWQPELFNETTYSVNTFYDPDSHLTFDVHKASFLGLSGQSDPFFYLNTLIPDNWKLLKSIEFNLIDDVLVRQLIVENDDQGKVIIHAWYEAGDYVGVSRLKLKLGILRSFMSGSVGQSFVAFSQRCENEKCESAVQQNLHFVQKWFTLNYAY